MYKSKFCGFSLIELMLVVAIIGVLAAIAWPRYLVFAQKARAADGQGDLLELSSFMERQYTAKNGYLKNLGGIDVIKNADLPFQNSARGGGGAAFYIYTVASTATTYTLTATPQLDQANYTGCGAAGIVMSVDELGAVLPATGCWK